MAKMFICHSSQDAEFARQLHRDLQLVGHEPWLGQVDIAAGDPIAAKVHEGIRSCPYMLVVLSKAAVSSVWVSAEWHAKLLGITRDSEEAVIPVLKEQCDVPDLLRNLLVADFSQSYDAGFRMLTGKIGYELSQLRVPKTAIPDNFRDAIEWDARTHEKDHLRIACAHTAWSLNPDRAKPILEDALRDVREEVRRHAEILLQSYKLSGRP